ncbi:hypothetical protein HMPREF9022_04314 [Erysipelotrichaceae bacterium 2_2_44A]|nr:hypothetical protein HMPREF9022_04314 [Erysipelotrichaceae bacterium 2_2_44A]
MMEDRYQRYQNTAFTSQQWYIIKKAIDEDIEVKDIADPRFSVEQLTLLIDDKEIRYRLIRIDRSGYQGRTAQTDIGKDSK